MITWRALSRWQIHSPKSGEQVGLGAPLGPRLGVERHLTEACIAVTFCKSWWVEVSLIQQTP